MLKRWANIKITYIKNLSENSIASFLCGKKNSPFYFASKFANSLYAPVTPAGNCLKNEIPV